eukprot:10285318-Alexandrium_andersonii.AAC.1
MIVAAEATACEFARPTLCKVHQGMARRFCLESAVFAPGEDDAWQRDAERALDVRKAGALEAGRLPPRAA